MGLSIKEVANLLGIAVNSVKMARYRIKQKLGMGKEDSLAEKIQSIVFQ
jgi:DNA-binding CsgD family transcriptional regulator